MPSPLSLDNIASYISVSTSTCPCGPTLYFFTLVLEIILEVPSASSVELSHDVSNTVNNLPLEATYSPAFFKLLTMLSPAQNA